MHMKATVQAWMEKSGKEEGMEGMVVILQKVRPPRVCGFLDDRLAGCPARNNSPLERPTQHSSVSHAHTTNGTRFIN